MKFIPHNYQKFALTWLINLSICENLPGGAFFLDPGLGKTSVTLLWVKLLQSIRFRKTLIVAPLRVVYSVWPKECQKWDQFQNIRVSIVHGSETQRIEALNVDADLYLVTADGVPWLMTWVSKQFNGLKKKAFPFDLLIIDESTKFKTCSAKRTKAMRHLALRFKKRVLLTGTPAPNSLEDLFPQITFLDNGGALGKSVSGFREKYFYRGGYGGYKWLIKPGSEEQIHAKIKHLCLRMNAVDHLDMPELVFNDVWVDLPPTVLKNYKKLEREMFLELDQARTLVANNAGSKYLKCRQFANGGVYDDDKNPVHLHTEKVDACLELLNELQGKPLLVAYQYWHDLERLKKVIPKLQEINSKVSGAKTDEIIEEWNKGNVQVLAVQPQSLSHGVNMQAGPGRDIFWLGLPDDLEIYLQLNTRIYRQGVTGQVRIHRCLATRTVDKAVLDRTESKDRSQTALLDSLAKYRSTHAEA